MKSGFQLWEFLVKHGYEKAAPGTHKIGNLIEVHPTIIFKKLKNPCIAPQRWINQRNIASKLTAQGKKQRRDILKAKFPAQKKVIDSLGIDFLDALIAAYTAEQFDKGQALSFGEMREGIICVPLR